MFKDLNSRVIKKFILLLLTIINVILIFNSPGIGSLNRFYNSSLGYSFGQKLILDFILNLFPVDIGNILFYRQTAWEVYKLVLFVFYLLSYVLFLFLSVKLVNKKTSKIDISLLYFGAVTVALISVALGYLEILAAPFVLFCIIYFFEKRFWWTFLFWTISVVFDWKLVVVGPLLAICERTRQRKLIRYLYYVFSVLLFFVWFRSTVPGFNSVAYNVYWLFNFPFTFVENYGEFASRNIVAILFFLLVTFLIVYSSGNLLRSFLSFFRLNPLSYVFPIIFFILLFILPNYSYLVFGGILYFVLLFKLKQNKSTSYGEFISSTLVVFIGACLFVPFVNEGGFLWVSFLSLLYFLTNQSLYRRLVVFLVNLIIFFNIYLFYGTSGLPPVRGAFYEIARFIIGMFSFGVLMWLLSFLVRKEIFKKRFIKGDLVRISTNIKKMIVILMVLVNVSHVTAQGSPDTVSWSQYANAIVEAKGNPFLAQTFEDQRYPPLSTAIQAFFVMPWNYFIGESDTYAIATKVSVFVFYFITVYLLMRLTGNKKKRWTKLFIVLTTFSIIIQTQGLADWNIYLVPQLFLSIYFIHKECFFWGGILYGLAISTKWQPIILLPLFGAYIFDLYRRNFREIFFRSVRFLSGISIIVLFSWMLVIIQPGGMEAFGRAFDFLKHGAPMLSGQAMNLNWIVTYWIHIYRPELDFSLQHLEGLNRQVPTGIAPFIFRGILFFVVSAILMAKYWFSKNKDLAKFLSTSLMIFFTHQILNKSAYEKHIFYSATFMLFLYLLRPTRSKRYLLVMFDIMTALNLILFYGFTGGKWFNRLFFGFDMTVLLSFVYVIIYLWILFKYLRNEKFLSG